MLYLNVFSVSRQINLFLNFKILKLHGFQKSLFYSFEKRVKIFFESYWGLKCIFKGNILRVNLVLSSALKMLICEHFYKSLKMQKKSIFLPANKPFCIMCKTIYGRFYKNVDILARFFSRKTGWL